MKIVSIVGARPQFIKAAAVSRKLRERHEEILVHTGQHYDYEMSGVFFDGLELPKPDVNLGIGSGMHGAQTGAMLKAIEDVVLAHRPDYVLVYGDTGLVGQAQQHGRAADKINALVKSYLGHGELTIVAVAEGYEVENGDGKAILAGAAHVS